MNSIAKNRYFDAFLKLMLLSAILHMGVLAINFILRGDHAPFNFFTIIAAQLFVPGLASEQALSLAIAFLLYVLILCCFTRKK
jgi:hypothetical protein